MSKRLPSGWRERTLGDLGSFSKGKGITRADLRSAGVPCITYGDIYTKHNFTIKEFSSFIEPQTAANSVALKDNDLLFAGSGETLEDIGKCVSFNLPLKACAGGDVIILSIPKECRADYLSYFLNSVGRKQLNKLGAGHAIVHIYKKDLATVRILLPPLPEQEAIASVLQIWSDAIKKTEALITAKQRQFKWLQSQSLPDTSSVNSAGKLSDYAQIHWSEPLTNAEGVNLLTVKLHCKGIAPNPRNVPIKISNRGRSYHQRCAGEFLIGRQNFHNGGFGIVPPELDGFVASNAISSLSVDVSKLSVKYLFYYFSRKSYYSRVGDRMDGTGQKEISDGQIMELPISPPPVEEQAKVVRALDTAQREIELLEQLADKYRTQQRGLMREFLTSEWRMPA